MIVFVLGPMIILLVYSFWTKKGFDLLPIFTLKNYRYFFQKPLYSSVLLGSLLIGLITSVLTILIAYPLTYALIYRYRKARELILFFILISLFSSYLVRVYAWKIILGKTGFINAMLLIIGIIKEPLPFLLYSKFAVIVTLVYIFIPFAVLPLFSALQNIEPALVEAAKDLGANRAGSFLKVTLPLSMPGVVSAFIFTFILSAGDYITPQLVGGASGLMIGKIIADQFGLVYNWPLGSAIAFILIASYFLVFIVIGQFNKRLRVRGVT
jgi:spermidine/putrescine transport system permease protein